VCINGYETRLLLWTSNQVESLKYSSYEMKSRYIYFKYFHAYRRPWLHGVSASQWHRKRGVDEFMCGKWREEKFQQKIFSNFSFTADEEQIKRDYSTVELFFLFNAKKNILRESFYCCFKLSATHMEFNRHWSNIIAKVRLPPHCVVINWRHKTRAADLSVEVLNFRIVQLNKLKAFKPLTWRVWQKSAAVIFNWRIFSEWL
jgi:hypothetical protein